MGLTRTRVSSRGGAGSRAGGRSGLSGGGAAASSLAAGRDSAVLWPVLTSLLLAVGLVALTAGVFRRNEL